VKTKKRRLRKIAFAWCTEVDLRGYVLYAKQLHPFKIPLHSSTEADLRQPNKEKLRETILTLRAQGLSYREIGREVGLHFTRVGQILKDLKTE
jgi:DNA invertase Pin-like site-specific DNA recombinase